jgi:hypothetical protein
MAWLILVMQKMLGTLLMIAVGLGFNSNEGGSSQGKTTYADRPTVETIHHADGIVKKIPGDEPVYLIDCASKYLRLHTINLPDSYKTEGMSVTVSGHIKATHTLEDDYGELFEITAIQ